MTFDKAKWETVYKNAAKTLEGNGPSDGIVCIMATLQYIKAGLKDDIIGTTPAEIAKATKDDLAFAQTVGDSLKELFGSCAEAKTLSGFASNASSAAKACDLTVQVTRQSVVDKF